MEFIEEHDCILFKLQDNENGATPRDVKIAVSIPKIFQKLEYLGINSDEFDDELYSIKYRHLIITKILCAYIKRFLQVTDYDPESMAQ